MRRTTAEQMREWRGPAILSFGFRPMFLIATAWAVIEMIAWIAMLSGHLNLPTRFDPVTWHAHAFLFGYLSAVIAGFLLTAVPNWTGRLPVVGWRLGGLSVLWIVGRLAVMASAGLPVWVVVVADSAFLVALWAVIAREIISGKKWNNLPVLLLVAVFMLANVVFHIEAANGVIAAQGYGLRSGVAVALVLVSLIAGKIIPSFTRNWLAKRGTENLPTPPMQRFDKATLLATILALGIWVVAPHAALTGLGLLTIAALHLIRLMRWSGVATLGEPLVWVLHLAYAFVPLGALFNGVAILTPGAISQATALHIWTAGALGLMTIAVMSRASLGHAGYPLTAGSGTTLVYGSLVMSVLARVAADFAPFYREGLLYLSALFWIGCFGGFVVVYGPMLVRAKKVAVP